MDERFVHLRDAAGNLRGTIAYLRPDALGRIKYAITVVSPTEPPHVVNPKVGRTKTSARLRSGGVADWKPYGKPGKFNPHFPYYLIRESNLQKIGWLPESIFRRLVRTIRAAVVEYEEEES